MVLSLATLATALFYLSRVPIKLAFCAKAGADAGFGFAVAPFERRFARRRAEIRCLAPKPSKPHRKTHIAPRDVPLLLRSAFKALKHAGLRIERLRIEGEFGAGDAAATALICGGLDALGRAVRAAAGCDVRLELRPDFSSARLHARLDGIISARAGHIILAALLGAFEYALGRLQHGQASD